jgi:hypothetical protein
MMFILLPITDKCPHSKTGCFFGEGNQVKVALRLTASQSVSLGVEPQTDICYCLTFMVLFLFGALSDEKTGLFFVYAAGLASAVLLGSESLGTRDFAFRRLLRLARSWWRYSTLPPHGRGGEPLSILSHYTQRNEMAVCTSLNFCQYNLTLYCSPLIECA